MGNKPPVDQEAPEGIAACPAATADTMRDPYAGSVAATG
jgi:hypothetical protein